MQGMNVRPEDRLLLCDLVPNRHGDSTEFSVLVIVTMHTCIHTLYVHTYIHAFKENTSIKIYETTKRSIPRKYQNSHRHRYRDIHAYI